MIKCSDCSWSGSEYEADWYRLPEPRFCTGWDIDHENAPCCPECGSLNVVEVPDDEDEDED